VDVAEQPSAEALLDAARIAERIGGLAAEIAAAYPELDRPLVLICVLKGSIFFTADLARAMAVPMAVPVEIDFIAVRSYQGRRSVGTVELVKDVGIDLHDRDVLVVEDIIDTGLTTSFLLDHLATHRPRSLRLVALLDKQARREREVRVDFTGFRIPDRFVVGYGLDVDERWRNLPDVRVVEDDQPPPGGPADFSPPRGGAGEICSPAGRASEPADRPPDG
jgi:hypoxanthine phosphoribosyltransferase